MMEVWRGGGEATRIPGLLAKGIYKSTSVGCGATDIGAEERMRASRREAAPGI
jgi:hypothetical protein